MTSGDKPIAALRCGWLVLLGTSALGAQPPAATGNAGPGTPLVLEAFEVTGSRVKRLDYETPAPVVTYTAAAIEEKGYDSFGDFMQSLPFNSGTANSEFTIGSFIAGAATINPRGLGPNRALTLVNGRRAVPYGLTSSASGTPQSMFNFNSVPTSAIERVEFLKDGASAIYGSDPITGVFNIILKKNYHGSTVDFSIANTLKHDSLNRRVNVATGLAAQGWEIAAGAQYQNRHSTYLTDYGITTTDFRSLGAKGQNFNSIANNPTYLDLTAAQAIASGLGSTAGYYVIGGGQPTANPTKASFTYVGPTSAGIPDANRFNLAPAQQFVPASENYGGYANLNRRFTPNLSGFAQFSASRSRLHAELPPFGFSPANLAGITLPATNPYNPLGISLTSANGGVGFTFLSAPRKNEISNRAETALAGLRGSVAKIWNWETAVSYGVNRAAQETDLIRAADLQAALNGPTRATAYNPFGPSDNPHLVSGLFTRSKVRDGRTDAVGGDVSVNGSFFQLPWTGAGELGLATGSEFRRETLRFATDTGTYLGGGGGGPFRGRRQTHSVYAEFSVPLQKWLELQIAGRHERYSDFGRTTKPKLGARIRLPANRFLHGLIRGSYSESFKAPDLGQLYQTQTLAVAGTFRDPLRPQDGARQLTALLGGNPGLKPEEGKVNYLGTVLMVPAIKGLSFSADYFDLAIRSVIFNRSVSYLLSPEGLKQFPGAIVRDNRVENPGPIAFVSGISGNIGFQLYRGWDFGLKYSPPETRVGRFNFSADATQTVKQGRDGGQGGGFSDATGKYFAPVWRSNLAVTWRHKDAGAAISADIIGKYFNNGFGAGWGENIYPVINPSLNWRGWGKTIVTVGATNVCDHRPPPNGYKVRGFDDQVYGAGALGRTLFLRMRQEF